MVTKEILKQYEAVIGLEIHVELKTRQKIFCGCPTAFGAPPNTQCCPVCTGMPGALPVFNPQVAVYAVKAGLALHCRIAERSRFDRKNYFYPDLPKAYQITQFYHPLCRDGYLMTETSNGEKRIGITRIHIEEDAGKLIHDSRAGTLIDCNRCGVPLIEIVTEPDFSNEQEVKAFLKKLRLYLLYTGVSDCRMNEGSLRCDVNLSVRKKGESKLGIRTEMKNLNSFQFIGKAIAYEFARQVEVMESGGEVVQETRRYEEKTGETASMRGKEDAADYRYFPEPDLPDVFCDPEMIRRLADEIPQLPDERMSRYRQQLTVQQAEQLCALPQAALYYDALTNAGVNPKTACNLLLAEIVPKLAGEQEIPMKPQRFAVLCRLLDDGKISNASARKVTAALWEQDLDPEEYVKEKDLLQITDPEKLREFARTAIAQDRKSLDSFLAGKNAAAQAIVGKALKLSGGKADPKLLRDHLLEILEKMKK